MKIFVKAKPKARKEKVEKISDNCFAVFVKEPAERGRANLAVINILADYFKVSQSEVKIVAGFASKKKIIEIKRALK